MIVVTMSGEVASDIHSTKAGDRIEHASFVLKSKDLSSLPMHWTIQASGTQADRAVNLLKKGAKLFLCGRVFAGGEPRKVSVSLSSFEVIG